MGFTRVHPSCWWKWSDRIPVSRPSSPTLPTHVPHYLKINTPFVEAWAQYLCMLKIQHGLYPKGREDSHSPVWPWNPCDTLGVLCVLHICRISKSPLRPTCSLKFPLARVCPQPPIARLDPRVSHLLDRVLQDPGDFLRPQTCPSHSLPEDIGSTFTLYVKLSSLVNNTFPISSEIWRGYWTKQWSVNFFLRG